MTNEKRLIEALRAILDAGHSDDDGDFILYRESDDDGKEIGPPPAIAHARALLDEIAPAR